MYSKYDDKINTIVLFLYETVVQYLINNNNCQTFSKFLTLHIVEQVKADEMVLY